MEVILIVLVILVILIHVAIVRWVFRIDTIVQLLTEIRDAVTPKPPPERSKYDRPIEDEGPAYDRVLGRGD